MPTGKAVSLRVRPTRSVDLCYPIDGVVCMQSANLLGQQVKGLDVEGLLLILSETVEGDRSRLKWDSGTIYEFLTIGGWDPDSPGECRLSYLRNRFQAATMDNAIRMRQNAYLTSYSPEVLEQVKKVFHDDPADQSAVQHRLVKQLEADSAHVNERLTEAYKTDGIWGKILTEASSTYDNKATQYSGGGHVQFEGISETRARGFEFRYPSAENDMRYRRARLGLRQEFLGAWRMAEMCRHGATTFTNELNTIDNEIVKLQAAYVDTFLISPFGGLVTGVFRNQGDYVQAGEPVIRVENDETVYLVGTMKYRGMLRVGDKVVVKTTLFDAEGALPTQISGAVSAVRGHDAVDEQWDVLITAENRDAAGNPVLPLNYNFDFESTTIDVVPA